jgi:hypothetical protein
VELRACASSTCYKAGSSKSRRAQSASLLMVMLIPVAQILQAAHGSAGGSRRLGVPAVLEAPVGASRYALRPHVGH